MFELKKNTYELKCSLTKMDSELNSSAATMYSPKKAYFCLEMLHSFIPAFDDYGEVAERSKFEVVVDAYKLGYLDCTSGVTPCNSIIDEDLKALCIDLLPSRREQINVVDMEEAEEQATNKTIDENNGTKEKSTEEGVAKEMLADVVEQTAGAA